MGVLFLEMCMMLHLVGLNDMSQFFSHFSSFNKSSCGISQSLFVITSLYIMLPSAKSSQILACHL